MTMKRKIVLLVVQLAVMLRIKIYIYGNARHLFSDVAFVL